VRDRVAIGYRSEHAFYRTVADHVRVPIPRSYHCAIDGDGWNSCCCWPIWPRRAGRPDRRVHGSGGHAGGAGTGRVHAPSWCDPELTDFPGIASPARTPGWPRGWAMSPRWPPRSPCSGSVTG
jgi:hypothetical protein